MRNGIRIGLMLCYSFVGLTAEDVQPSLSSDKEEERLLAVKQIDGLRERLTIEPRQILIRSPRLKESVSQTHPIALSLDILGRLRAYESHEVIIKHIATTTEPKNGLISSEYNYDYITRHPAIKALMSIGPQIIPKCIDQLELEGNPDVPCLLAAVAKISGSNALAKQTLRERLVATKDKDVQARLKKILIDYDKIIHEEVEAPYALKNITYEPEWEKTK